MWRWRWLQNDVFDDYDDNDDFDADEDDEFDDDDMDDDDFDADDIDVFLMGSWPRAALAPASD